jgi:tRNA pseudouridine55 synthase
MRDAVPRSGFLLVDKESGWTSHDVVAKIRGAVGGKTGHSGTLDPLATGLLVIGLGRSTRLLRFIQGFDKEYVATAQFGVATDSLDADGSVLSRDPLPVDQGEVEAAAGRFVGDILQVPPMVSARKVEGRRLYALARKGEEVDREPRPVHIAELEILDLAPSDYPVVTFRLVCGSGTYVRTLADDMARSLGGRAHLIALRRTRSGSLEVADARPVSAIAAAAEDDSIDELIVSPASALAPIPSVDVTAEVQATVCNGGAVAAEAVGSPDSRLVRLLDPRGALLGVYRVEGDIARPEVVTA